MLTEREYEEETFNQQIWIECNLKHKVFSSSTFTGCDFTRSDLTGCRFSECTMKNCNFSLVKLDGVRLHNVTFENCKFVGVNFSKCEGMMLSLKFKGSLFDTCDFSNLDLKNTPFIECTVRNGLFNYSKLAGADFSRSDLRGTIFDNADLSKADFRTSVNYSINPLTNKLTKAKFSVPEVLSLLKHIDITIE